MLRAPTTLRTEPAAATTPRSRPLRTYLVQVAHKPGLGCPVPPRPAPPRFAPPTDSEVAVIVFDRRGRLYQYCSGEMGDVLGRYARACTDPHESHTTEDVRPPPYLLHTACRLRLRSKLGSMRVRPPADQAES